MKSVTIQKPWGSEYLLYQNEHLGIWHLKINPGAQTSFHCHPNKKTGFMVMDGTAIVSFMNGTRVLHPGEKVMIHKGVFHSTAAYNAAKPGAVGVELLEVESPNDKDDIVRLEDIYGRVDSPFIDNKQLEEQPSLGLVSKIGKCTLTYWHYDKYKQVQNRHPSNLLILEGTMSYKGRIISTPGDVLDDVSFGRLASRFDCTPMELLEIRVG